MLGQWADCASAITERFYTPEGQRASRMCVYIDIHTYIHLYIYTLGLEYFKVYMLSRYSDVLWIWTLWETGAGQVAYVKDGQAAVEDRFARWIEEPLKEGVLRKTVQLSVPGNGSNLTPIDLYTQFLFRVMDSE